MCGRYTNEAEFSQIRTVFRADDAVEATWRPTYNISPNPEAGSEQPIVLATPDGTRSVRLARWWLIPQWWSKPLRELPTTFNARSEDAARKPFFREAFAKSRCLVPATGWREFTGARGSRQPHHFVLPACGPFCAASSTGELEYTGQPLFAFAGLHSRWRSAEGQSVDTFAIVTAAPTPQAARIHNRMPVVLPCSSYEQWLAPDGKANDVLSEARERAEHLQLNIFPTDPIGNSSRYEGPEVIARQLSLFE